VHAFYVCIDKILYEVSTALEAIDLCFKIFDLHYPSEDKYI